MEDLYQIILILSYLILFDIILILFKIKPVFVIAFLKSLEGQILKILSSYSKRYLETYAQHLIEVAFAEIMAQALLIAREQAVINKEGKFVATPKMTVYNYKRKDGNEVKIEAGRFYRKNNDDIFFGLKATIGSSGQKTTLYPVDRTAIPSGFTITYVPLGEGE